KLTSGTAMPVGVNLTSTWPVCYPGVGLAYFCGLIGFLPGGVLRWELAASRLRRAIHENVPKYSAWYARRIAVTMEILNRPVRGRWLVADSEPRGMWEVRLF